MRTRILSARYRELLARLVSTRGTAFILAVSMCVVSSLALHIGKLQATANPLPVATSEGAGVETAYVLAEALGVRFVEGSISSLILEREGKQYIVDLASRNIRENEPSLPVASAEIQQTQQTQQIQEIQQTQQTAPASSQGARIFREQCSMCHGADGRGGVAGTPDLTDPAVRSRLSDQTIVETIRNGKSGTAMQAFTGTLAEDAIQDVALFVQSLSSPQGGGTANIYEPPDDFVYSLPTGRRLPRNSLYVNFTHRFAYNPAFSGRGLGNTLLGLDGFSLSSFGFRYGITDKLSVSAYRSPSLIGRPIEFLAAYNVLDEHDGHPMNASVRVSVDGQDHFTQNFTTNFEGIISRSLSGRGQFYAIPTVSLQNRRLLSKPGALENPPANLPGINSFSLGVALAVDIRPTLAVVAEVIPTLVNGRDLGIHRPAYAFGIQKRVLGHAFTIGFSNGPGAIVSQRAGTRATFLGNPSADKPRGLFIGFNLMRRLR